MANRFPRTAVTAVAVCVAVVRGRRVCLNTTTNHADLGTFGSGAHTTRSGDDPCGFVSAYAGDYDTWPGDYGEVPFFDFHSEGATRLGFPSIEGEVGHFTVTYDLHREPS